jgi:hypothetical protein
VTRLDSRPAWDYQLSRSGRWLFSNFGPELFEQRGLAMIDVPAGSVHDLLAPGAGPFRVKASPDGLGVAYYDRRAIRLLAPWGSPEMWRASVQANCLYNWSWSPEGDRLAVVGFGCQSPSGIELLWSRPFAGVSHSLGAPWINSPAAWSPCGSYLAAFRRTGGPQNDLVLVHVPSGQVTPLHPSATQVSKYGVVWSPFRDEVAWINVSGATNTTEVFRAGTGLAPAPAVVGPLTPGSRNRVLLRAPVEVGRAYRMGAAFSSTPGLPTPQGTIPLSLDPLLLASRSASEVFEGFGGVLDGSGRAEASLNVPPGDRLSGMRFYLAYVTLDSSGGLRMISAAIPVFVQPR